MNFSQFLELPAWKIAAGAGGFIASTYKGYQVVKGWAKSASADRVKENQGWREVEAISGIGVATAEISAPAPFDRAKLTRLSLVTVFGLLAIGSLFVLFVGVMDYLYPPTVHPTSANAVYRDVGCGEANSAEVSFPLPEGARLASQPVVAWRDVNNTKGTAVTPASVSGNVVSARGTISGLDKQFLGNCPGGGHATLTMSGSYELPGWRGFR